MSIRVSCPCCKKVLTFADAFAGAEVQCQYCAEMVQVGAKASAPKPPADEPDLSVLEQEIAELPILEQITPDPPKPAPRPQSKPAVKPSRSGSIPRPEREESTPNPAKRLRESAP